KKLVHGLRFGPDHTAIWFVPVVVQPADYVANGLAVERAALCEAIPAEAGAIVEKCGQRAVLVASASSGALSHNLPTAVLLAKDGDAVVVAPSVKIKIIVDFY